MGDRTCLRFDATVRGTLVHPQILMKRPSQKPFRVGRSRTGLGLFATKPIVKGALIVEYWGRRVPTRTADDINSKYLFEINSRWTVDGATRRNVARYINHSCRPNAEPDIRKGRILISAKRAIAPGDEITYNYGRNYFSTFIAPMGCKCAHCLRKLRDARAQARRKRSARKSKAAAAATRKSKAAAATRKSKPAATRKAGAKPRTKTGGTKARPRRD